MTLPTAASTISHRSIPPGPSDITFLDKPKYVDALADTRAGACLDCAALYGSRRRADSHFWRRRILTRPSSRSPASSSRRCCDRRLLFDTKDRAASAQVHPTARLEAGVTVDPLAVIGPHAEVGAGTLIGVRTVIGPDVCIGRDCSIGPDATILHALIGDRVIIHPGVRIGQDGFGYLPSPLGHLKIPQTRRVIVQDDVEIGANTTIDRGATRDTVIGEGTKIDNLVQIGHNCSIGRHCLIVSHVGISGSVDVGDFVVLTGQVGIADHVTIGAGAVLGGRAGVMSNVPAGARWAGTPAEPATDWKRGVVLLRRLARRRNGSDETGG